MSRAEAAKDGMASLWAHLRQLAQLLPAFLRRDWKIAISYRLAFATQIVQSTITLFTLYFLGRLVSTQSIHIGHSASLRLGYFPFAVIGVALLGLVTTQLKTVSSQLRSDQTTGTFEALLAMPPPPWLSVMGSVAFQLLYATASALVTVLIAIIGFGMRFHADPGSIAFATAGLVVALALFVSLGVGFAAAVVVFKRGGAVGGALAAAFSLLGGVYYPTSLLPGPLHALSTILPFTWALDVIRAGLLERRLLWGELGLLLAVACVCVPCSLRIFTASVARARRSGTLGQY
jgi:ABC-2 type transport system permease protein